MACDPNNSQTVWSGGQEITPTSRMLVSKSLNGGNTWTRYIRTQCKGFCYSLAVDPVNSSIVYAGGCSDSGIVLQKTTNGGSSWSSSSSGITSDTTYCIAIDPQSASTIYAATPDGVFKSTNAGGNWSYSGCTNVVALIIDPTQSNTIYAGTQNGIYRSTNYGISWSEMNSGLTDLNVTCLDIASDTYLYCGTCTSGIFRWSLAVHVNENKTNARSGNVLLFTSPNPAIDQAMIHFDITAKVNAEICIYNTQGSLIATLANREFDPGKHNISWNGSDNNGRKVSSGIYFIKLQTKENTFTGKLLLIAR